MKAKYLFVMGPKAPQFSATEDLGISDKEAKQWGEFLHKELKPHLLQFSQKYAYIICPRRGWGSTPFLVTGHSGEFYDAYIGNNPKGYTIESPVKVRRLELIDNEFYCTDEYSKEVSQLKRDWPHKKMYALDP